MSSQAKPEKRVKLGSAALVLSAEDRKILEALQAHTGLGRADVVRVSLRALARESFGPSWVAPRRAASPDSAPDQTGTDG